MCIRMYVCVCMGVCPNSWCSGKHWALGISHYQRDFFFQIYKDTFSDAFCMFGGVSSINIQLTARRRRRWWNFALWRRLRQLRPLSTVLNMVPIISWRYVPIRVCVHTRMHTRMYEQRGIHAYMRHACMLQACIYAYLQTDLLLNVYVHMRMHTHIYV